MSRLRKYGIAGSTFMVALGIGFVMQNGDALAARFGSDDELRAAQAEALARNPDQGAILSAPVKVQGASTLGATGPVMAPPAPADSVTTIELPDNDSAPEVPTLPIQLAFAGSSVGPAEVAEEDEIELALAETDIPSVGPPSTASAAEAADCSIRMLAEPAAVALVEVSVDAPCNPDAQFTLHHQGMMFTALTDSDGLAQMTVPALAVEAVFIASFPNNVGSMAIADVPGLADFHRAVLQWQGDAGLELHALENGAEYGEDGHVHNAAARGPDALKAGNGGFLVRLGDPRGQSPLLAEVYTYPRGENGRSGWVALSAEAEITDANCGRSVAAQSIQIAPGAKPTALDLTLTMPDCDAVGDFLVLQSMFEDLTLAAR